MEPVLPVFGNNSIPIVFACTTRFLQFCSVAVRSLLDNNPTKRPLDILILGSDAEADRQRWEFDRAWHLLCSMGADNVSIRRINMDPYIKAKTIKFYSSIGLPVASYFRFFLPHLCQAYSKVLYIDSDLVFVDDIADLFDSDVHDSLLGAVRDQIINVFYAINYDTVKKTIWEKMKLSTTGNYFNSGVLLLNIPQMIQQDFTDQLLDRLQSVGTPRYGDQDILNAVCEGKVTLLPSRWNLLNSYIEICRDWDAQPNGPDPRVIIPDGKAALADPGVVHFAGNKPWERSDAPGHDVFWRCAEKSPFFNELRMTKAVSEIQRKCVIYARSLPKYRRKYRIAQLLSLLPGSLGKKWATRLPEYKALREGKFL